MNIQTVKVKERFESLKKIGLATEHFPSYVNLESRLHKVDVVLLSFIIKGKGVHLMEGEKFPESGTSLSITHYEQNHCIITDRAGEGLPLDLVWPCCPGPKALLLKGLFGRPHRLTPNLLSTLCLACIRFVII